DGPVIGWRSDVEQMPRNAVYHHYKTHYGPNNAVVVIVGDFQTPRALEMVRRHFGPLKRIPTPPPVYTVEPPQRGERRGVVKQAGALPIVMAAYKAPAAKSPDFYALDVLGTVLGEGRASRLYRRLVRQELASGHEAGAPSLRDPSLFYVTATARQGVTADKLEAAMLEEVQRLVTAPIDAPQLARAQRQIEASFAYQTHNVAAPAPEIGHWAMGDDWRSRTRYLEGIGALPPADVQAVARKYFGAETRTVGHFLPTAGGDQPAPPPAESAARVEKPSRGARPIPLPAASAPRS